MRLSVIVDTSNSSNARLQPVPVSAVRLRDEFWQPRRNINRHQTLESQLKNCEDTGRINNFRIAGGLMEGEFEGIYFNDSDVYKWVEAAAWTLADEFDAELDAQLDEVIAIIAAAQQPDGYLNTYFTFERAGERWTNLLDMHELYCAGHFIQGAIAHFRATGKTSALEVATRLADCICKVFGDGEGQLRQTDGHEEIEMALIELFRTTGQQKYFDQAKFFLEVRGHGTIGGSRNLQDHEPITEQCRMTGHAVRHTYLNCGATDLILENENEAIHQALHRLWHNMTEMQMYISGGVGSRWDGEAFGNDYELPNARAYTETCAAIGNAMWNWRMLQLEGDARYADVFELALYNGMLSGLSLDGQEYFYQNPLQDDGHHRRQPWFGTACCPPNIARLLAQLPGYFYSVSDDAVWVHLYASSDANITLPDGREVKLSQTTNYPLEGEVTIEIGTAGEFTLLLRDPSRTERKQLQVQVNGEHLEYSTEKGYLVINRSWCVGDRVRLVWPMQPQMFQAHPYALENNGRVALMRGPLLYCFEGVDHPGVDLRDAAVAPDTQWRAGEDASGLNGTVTLKAEAQVAIPAEKWKGRLYAPAGVTSTVTHEHKKASLTAIPYYAWANREPGQLQVWLKTI